MPASVSPAGLKLLRSSVNGRPVASRTWFSAADTLNPWVSESKETSVVKGETAVQPPGAIICITSGRPVTRSVPPWTTIWPSESSSLPLPFVSTLAGTSMTKLPVVVVYPWGSPGSRTLLKFVSRNSRPPLTKPPQAPPGLEMKLVTALPPADATPPIEAAGLDSFFATST